MRLDGIHEDDLVLCDVRGTRFYAAVREVLDGELRILPVNGSNVTYRRVNARQVVHHFAKRGRARQPRGRRGEVLRVGAGREVPR